MAEIGFENQHNNDRLPTVRVRGLTKRYGKSTALDQVNFEVMPGRIVGLIGPNGSGKTTALKALLGLIPSEGEIRVLGLDPRTQRDTLMREVCFIADVAVLPRWLRVCDAVDFVAAVHPRFNREKAMRYIGKTKLTPVMKVKDMSKGMVVQLHLALVMAIDARLLVLDEPTLGLDILYRKQFYQTLVEDYFDDDKTVIISTHQVDEIEHVLSDLIFIREGHIALAATMDDIAERFVEVTISAEQLAAAKALQPIYERQAFGKSIMLFDGVSRAEAERLGQSRQPSITDLFIGTMSQPSTKGNFV
jgi:ABC-2 type transport system ATP-binding protein